MHATNSYAIPFDEDPKQPGIWFVDHMYHEKMFDMFRKINANEKILGWYTTGKHYKNHDIDINELFKRYVGNPVFLMVDVENNDPLNLPTEAHISIEAVDTQGIIVKNFKHIPTSVEAYEAEEVGVEHLLRDMKDVNMDSLTNSVGKKILGLKGLVSKLAIVNQYLTRVEDGSMAVDNQIMFNLQELLNIMPKLADETKLKAFQVKTNDNYFTIYVSSIVRAVISIHDLINNKLSAKRLDLEKIKEKNKDKDDKKVVEVAGEGKEATEKKADADKK